MEAGKNRKTAADTVHRPDHDLQRLPAGLLRADRGGRRRFMARWAILQKTNVMSAAITEYTNKGIFEKGIAIGIILVALSFLLNPAVFLLQERVSR